MAERAFEDRQQRYYSQELNRTLPTRGPNIEASALELALGNVDPTMPREIRMAPEIQALTSDFGAQSTALQREATCRAMPYPGPAMRAADARTGCGWWFVPDSNQQSIGAYGSRRGPMDPKLKGGEWIWDPQEAYKREAQKEAASIKSCKDVENPILLKNQKIGWCHSTGRAVVTDGNGNAAYPQSMGGDCPDNNFTMPNQKCPPPPPPSEWQLLMGMGGNQGISELCQPTNGVLAPGCLGAISNAVMGSGGVMTQSFRSGYAGSSDAFNETNRYLQNRGFTIDQGVITDGRISVDRALATVKAVKAQADAVDGSRMTAAAANLAYGTAFNPCPVSRDERPPYDANCIKRAAMEMGYSPDGTIMQPSINVGYWNNKSKNWGEVLDELRWIKALADRGAEVGDVKYQPIALKQVYGVDVKYPKQGCNNFGILMYRYFFPTWDGALFPAKGPQTHFLGRYILKDGFPAQGSTLQDQTPGGGYLTEGQRMVADFYPKRGGTYQFLIQCDDFVRLQVNGAVVGEVGCCGVPTPTKTVQMIANQPYTMIVDLWNGGGPWSFGISMSVDGSQWAGIPADQLKMHKDRRLAMIDLPFSKLSEGPLSSDRANAFNPICYSNLYGDLKAAFGPGFTQTSVDNLRNHYNLRGRIPEENRQDACPGIADTNNIFQNLVLQNSSFGTLNGQRCMIVKGVGSCLTNTGGSFVQGVRVRAMKSFTMKLLISDVQWPTGTTPSIVGFFNLPDTNITGRPRTSMTMTNRQYIYSERKNDFMITATKNLIYPWGIRPNISDSGVETRSFPTGQWFHLAFVWDDDFKGYTMYIDGKAGTPFKLKTAPYPADLMMEQIRIGCDVHPEGQNWSGGIAWFRAFDYRLNDELIKRDMDDAWDSLA